MHFACYSLLSWFYRLLHETKLKVKSRRASGKLAAAVDEAAAVSVAVEVPQEDDTKKRVDQLVPV